MNMLNFPRQLRLFDGVVDLRVEALKARVSGVGMARKTGSAVARPGRRNRL